MNYYKQQSKNSLPKQSLLTELYQRLEAKVFKHYVKVFIAACWAFVITAIAFCIINYYPILILK